MGNERAKVLVVVIAGPQNEPDMTGRRDESHIPMQTPREPGDAVPGHSGGTAVDRKSAAQLDDEAESVIRTGCGVGFDGGNNSAA
jgi:hypothetical protein